MRQPQQLLPCATAAVQQALQGHSRPNGSRHTGSRPGMMPVACALRALAGKGVHSARLYAGSAAYDTGRLEGGRRGALRVAGRFTCLLCVSCLDAEPASWPHMQQTGSAACNRHSRRASRPSQLRELQHQRLAAARLLEADAATAAQPDALRDKQPDAVPLQPPVAPEQGHEAALDAIVALEPEGAMPSAEAESRPEEVRRTPDTGISDADLEAAAAAGAKPAAGLQHPAQHWRQSPAEPLRSMPHSLTKVLQGATFEASPLGDTKAVRSKPPQQEHAMQRAEKPANAWDEKRRRLGRRYARAAKQWRKVTSRQQQRPGTHPAPTFRTAPLAGLSADQLNAAPHAAQLPAAKQPSAVPSHDESHGHTHPDADNQHPQQQLAQDTSLADPAHPQETAASSDLQDAGAPAGWGRSEHAASAARTDDQSHEAAAEEAAATAARQQQALQRAEELRVTDTLQPPPPVHDSLSRSSSGRIKVASSQRLKLHLVQHCKITSLHIAGFEPSSFWEHGEGG